jgi:thiol:disulfide interchange protein DsbD
MHSILASLDVALHGSRFTAIILVFAGGLLSSLTPCVYPMIPITISVIGGQKQTSRFHAFFLSVFYVLGIAVIYTSLGIAAVASGTLFGSISSNTWVLFAVANICLIFGLSMFDVFYVNIPFLSNLRVGKARGGSFVGVFLMGMIFGLVASPCTAPALGVILAFVATTKSYVYGGALLFAYALGLGTLLIVIGTFSGALGRLPKSGKWMVYVKKVFGVVMFGMAEYFLVQMGKGMF